MLSTSAAEAPERRYPRTLIYLLLSVLLHVLLLASGRVAVRLFPADPESKFSKWKHKPPVEVIVVEAFEPADPPMPDEIDGQLVEVAPPDREHHPTEADYLSEYDISVPEETRSERYAINPEVLAPSFSKEQKVKADQAEDVDATDPGLGAKVGSQVDRFDPERDGRLATLPSPFQRTNRDGNDKPVPASLADSFLAGAPQNDLLREKVGPRTQLNTKEYLYASYLNRIRRLVNFYWQQNLDNLPRSVRLSKPQYTTSVKSVLDADGSLEIVSIVSESGSSEIDDCVVRAFRVAGPYPNPPEGLVEKDGRVYLPGMSFTVELGIARAQYQGVDPRAGVQFPGILKAPR